MIHFDREAWTTIFYWEGGIIREIARPSSFYLLYLVGLVVVESFFGNLNLHIEKSALGMIMSFLVFLLVFRVNSTHSSHRNTAHEVNQFFCTIESLVEVCCTSLRGADPADPPDMQRHHVEMALLTKLNVIRMSLAFAISFVFHASLITAVTEAQGEIDEASLQDLVFFRHRLQGLLYSQEMKLVDQAICIMQEDALDDMDGRQSWVDKLLSRVSGDDGPATVYRGEASRHGRRVDCDGKVLLGAQADVVDENSESGENISVVPLPKVIMPMLLFALKKPMFQPWGFSDRIWGLFSKHIADMKSGVAVIDTMCTTPTPLPYVQLSHILVLIFAVFYPLTIDVSAGYVDTVLMPFLIYFTIQGFETLAKMLETATGHDVTDLNFLEMIHNLELHVKQIFDSTEMYSRSLNESLNYPLKSFTCFTSEHNAEKPCAPMRNLPRHFGAYFHWLPMPTAILETLLQAHGHADALKQISKCKHKAKLRNLIRVAMKRMHAGKLYTLLEASPDATPADYKAAQKALGFIRQDPNLFSHYVVFAGVYDPFKNQGPIVDSTGSSTTKGPGHSNWKQHVGKMLHKHSAGRLFGFSGEDSARSVLATFRDIDLDLETPSSDRDRGFRRSSTIHDLHSDKPTPALGSHSRPVAAPVETAAARAAPSSAAAAAVAVPLLAAATVPSPPTPLVVAAEALPRSAGSRETVPWHTEPVARVGAGASAQLGDAASLFNIPPSQAPAIGPSQAPAVGPLQATAASSRQAPAASARQAPVASSRQAPVVPSTSRPAPAANSQQVPDESSLGSTVSRALAQFSAAREKLAAIRIQHDRAEELYESALRKLKHLDVDSPRDAQAASDPCGAPGVFINSLRRSRSLPDLPEDLSSGQ